MTSSRAAQPSRVRILTSTSERRGLLRRSWHRLLRCPRIASELHLGSTSRIAPVAVKVVIPRNANAFPRGLGAMKRHRRAIDDHSAGHYHAILLATNLIADAGYCAAIHVGVRRAGHHVRQRTSLTLIRRRFGAGPHTYFFNQFCWLTTTDFPSRRKFGGTLVLFVWGNQVDVLPALKYGDSYS